MRSRQLVTLLFFVAALSNINGISLFPFLPTIADELGTTVSVIGQSVTIALIGGATIGLIAGPLADHFGRRRFLIFGTALMSMSSAGTALATTFELLIVARLMGGLAMGLMAGIGASIVSSTLTGDARRSALSWVVSGAAFGAVAGPPLVVTIAAFSTWRVGFWFLALAPWLLIIVCLRLINPDPQRVENRFHWMETVHSYRRLLADRRSAMLQVGTLCWAIPWLGGSAYLGSYLIQGHGLSITGAGYGYMWAAFWFMVGPRVAMLLLRIVNLYPLLVASSLLMSAATMTLFWMPIGLPWLLIFMLIWPMNAGIGMPLISSAISEAARTGQSTAMMGRQFSWTLGGAVGASLGGVLIATGGYALFGIVTGSFALVMAALALLAMQLDREPVQHEVRNVVEPQLADDALTS